MSTSKNGGFGSAEPLLRSSQADEVEDSATGGHDLAVTIEEDHPNQVEIFVQTHNLSDHIKLFQKAASLIHNAEEIELTLEENLALQDETQHKWRQPSTLYFTILICSLGAVEQGWAQTAANGATLFFPDAFGIGSDSSHDTFLVGLINCAPYMIVGLGGAWLSDPINNAFGRRGAVLIGSILCLLASAGSALTTSWQLLLLFRLVLGLGLGVNASTVNPWTAETAPSYIRGGLAVSWQMFTAFGIFIGFVTNLAMYDYGAKAWRLQLGAALVPTIPLIIMVYVCPESASWYIKNGQRYDLAFQSLCRLRNTELQAAIELYATYSQQKPRSPQSQTSLISRILQLFTIPRIRRATLASWTVMIAQQLCGINIVAFYSSNIFSSSGFSTFQALLASCVFGLVNFIGALPAIWTMDTLGRRSWLLLTLPIMAVTMLATGLTLNIPEDHPFRLGLLAFLIYLFCAEYSPGMGPVPSAYAAEVFPLSHREVGMSFAVATANCWAAILSLTFPRILTGLGPAGSFELYAGLNILALILVFLFLPETKLKTLDELDEVFAVPTRSFIRHQVGVVLPWGFKRHILRQNDAILKPMGSEREYQDVEQDDND